MYNVRHMYLIINIYECYSMRSVSGLVNAELSEDLQFKSILKTVSGKKRPAFFLIISKCLDQLENPFHTG